MGSQQGIEKQEEIAAFDVACWEVVGGDKRGGGGLSGDTGEDRRHQEESTQSDFTS